MTGKCIYCKKNYTIEDNISDSDFAGILFCSDSCAKQYIPTIKDKAKKDGLTLLLSLAPKRK